jgi:hypothetical protein
MYRIWADWVRVTIACYVLPLNADHLLAKITK